MYAKSPFRYPLKSVSVRYGPFRYPESPFRYPRKSVPVRSGKSKPIDMLKPGISLKEPDDIFQCTRSVFNDPTPADTRVRSGAVVSATDYVSRGLLFETWPGRRSFWPKASHICGRVEKPQPQGGTLIVYIYIGLADSFGVIILKFSICVFFFRNITIFWGSEFFKDIFWGLLIN